MAQIDLCVPIYMRVYRHVCLNISTESKIYKLSNQSWYLQHFIFFNQELLLEILVKGQFLSMQPVTLLNNCVMHSALRRLIGLSQYLTTHFCLHDCG